MRCWRSVVVLIVAAVAALLFAAPAGASKPAISISGGQATEGAAGATNSVEFIVKLSKAVKRKRGHKAKAATVAYSTSEGTAGATDFTPASGKLSFKKRK